MAQPLYDQHFYAWQSGPSRRSAAAVIPLIREAVGPVRSVLDVGCGIGTWLAEWASSGVHDLMGVDGDYIDRSELLIPSERFRSADLTRPFDLGRTFDAVISLEVAEHLPESAAGMFVETLTRHAPVVVFSAAVPCQTGLGHVNEQWQSYWAAKFAKAGYDAFDVIRWRVWDNAEISFWYRQNIVIYAAAGHLKMPARWPVDVAHPGLVNTWQRMPWTEKLWLSLPASGRRLLHAARHPLNR